MPATAWARTTRTHRGSLQSIPCPQPLQRSRWLRRLQGQSLWDESWFHRLNPSKSSTVPTLWYYLIYVFLPPAEPFGGLLTMMPWQRWNWSLTPRYPPNQSPAHPQPSTARPPGSPPLAHLSPTRTMETFFSWTPGFVTSQPTTRSFHPQVCYPTVSVGRYLTYLFSVQIRQVHDTSRRVLLGGSQHGPIQAPQFWLLPCRFLSAPGRHESQI